MKSLLGRLVRRWPWFVAGALTVMAVVAAFSMLAPKQYSAQASDFFTVNSGGGDADMYQGSIFVSSQMGSYRALAVSPVVLGPVVERLKLDMTAEELSQKVVVTSPEETTILTIQVTLPEAQQSADVANAVAEELTTQAIALSPVRNTGKPVVAAKVYEKATTPLLPSSPNAANNMAFGLLGALAGGLALAFGRDALDKSVGSGKALASMGVPVVGRLPRERRLAPGEQIASAAGRQAVELLRDNFLAAPVGPGGTRAVVTSLHRGEGKTTLAMSLSRALSASGRRTLLVDASEDGGVSTALGMVGAPGLAELVEGQRVLAQPSTETGCDVIPMGSAPFKVGSPRIGELFRSWSEAYDAVVIDGVSFDQPGRLQDIAQGASDVIWVVDSATPRSELEEATRVRFAPETTVSLVLNRVHAGDSTFALQSRGEGASPAGPRRHR